MTRPCSVHFVGFKDERYNHARKVWKPDFIHRFYDHRCVAEIMEGDIVIFADGQPAEINPYSYDDSAHF